MCGLLGCQGASMAPESERCGSRRCMYSFFEERTYTVNDTIFTFPLLVLEEGNELVFRYTPYEPSSSDRHVPEEGRVDQFYFKVSADLESFSFEDEELENIELTLQPFHNHPFDDIVYAAIDIRKGTVRGEKQRDNRWEIEMVIRYGDPGNESQEEVDAIFWLKEL